MSQVDLDSTIPRRNLRSVRRVGVSVLLMLVAFGVQAQLDGTARIDLRVVDGRLTLKADHASVSEVLRRVAQSSRSRLVLPDDLGGRIGSWDLRDVPIPEGVARIARPANVFIVHGPDQAGGSDPPVREIHVFAAPDAHAGQAVDVSNEDRARVSDIARLLATAPDSAVRMTAIRELGSIGTEQAATVLEGMLGGADRDVIVEAIEALGRVDSARSVRLAGQMAMGTKDPEVRAAAIRVLESSRSDSAIVLLKAVMSQPPSTPTARPRPSDPGVRR